LERATFVGRDTWSAPSGRSEAPTTTLTRLRGRTPFYQPPAYDDVVERFGIDILGTPGGLVLKGGDIALTKRGELMLNHADYSAMLRLVQGWRYNPR
jgi:hypothetical protein